MPIGPTKTKASLDAALLADAQYLITVAQTAAKRHEQYLLTMPTTLAGLQAIDATYVQADLDHLNGIGFQWDRLQTLLGGTIPTSAANAVNDACAVLDATHSFPSG